MTIALFEPFYSRSVKIPNRIVISPMGQYSAVDGHAGDWHMATYGKYAQGRPGLVIVENIAVTAEGRGTYGDIGLWNDEQGESLARIAHFIASQGVVPGIQLGHAGRKATTQRPWEGYQPLAAVKEKNGDAAWIPVAPSPLPYTDDASVPHELSNDEIRHLIDDFVCAAERAVNAGFKVIELHAAHGYLIHQFLSPVSNQREDEWGGDAQRRMAFPLELIRRVRAALPDELPLWVRVSATDEVEEGRTLADTIEFVKQAREMGVDLIDCSNGGFSGDKTAQRIKRDFGYLVPFASEIKNQTEMPVMAVGLITKPDLAEDIIQSDHADLVAIAREAIHNPNWPLHAYEALCNPNFDVWPPQFGWWLEKRSQAFDEAGLKPD